MKMVLLVPLSITMALGDITLETTNIVIPHMVTTSAHSLIMIGQICTMYIHTTTQTEWADITHLTNKKLCHSGMK